MFAKISNDDYNKMLLRIGKAYLPPEPKKKKPTLKQIFFYKKKFK